MRTTGKIGLGIAAAFGALYGAYALGSNSQDNSPAKPLEEAVCEEVDTQEIYDRGESRGYVLGLMAGRREGEVIGEREGREDGFESGKQYGLNACNDERYNEGLEACDDTKYAEGLKACDDDRYQEGQVIGASLEREECRDKLNNTMGAGTIFSEDPYSYIFETRRETHEELMTYEVNISKDSGCVLKIVKITKVNWRNGNYRNWRTFALNDGGNPECRPDGNVDSIRIKSPDEYQFFNREQDYSNNLELFEWADQKMQETTEMVSYQVDIYPP